jgi:two-component system sensor histidine kinase DesK
VADRFADEAGGGRGMTMNPVQALQRLHARLLPTHVIEQGWAPFWSLLYLGFLFMNWSNAQLSIWLPATLASIAIFLPLYFSALWRSGRGVLIHAAAIAALGFALTPFNTSANTYLIYAGAILPASGISLRASMATIFTGLALYAIELAVVLQWPPRFVFITIAIAAIVSTAIGAVNHFQREKRLRQAELKLSHDEVRRLGALAERERIGRDLHDLLGHTLSLITLKSELAMKLFDRDPLAARREIVDVERVARDALGQVRRAVSGIRTAGLAAELASARLLLESGDIRLEYDLGDAVLPPEIETVFALTVREAVTNAQRHARAGRVRIHVVVESGEARLVVADDGNGGVVIPGNGLAGMRERLQMLGGRLEIESARGKGTRLVAVLSLPATAVPARTATLAG